MKKIISVLIFISCLTSHKSNAQIVQQGNFVAEGYVGFVSLGNVAWKKYAEDNAYDVEAKFITPYGLRIEYAFVDRISAGLEYNYNYRELSWKKDDTTSVAPLVIAPFKYSIIQKIHRFMPRITAHFGDEKLEFFVGIGLGLRIANYKTKVTPDKPNWEFGWPGFNPFAFRASLGVKFYPMKNVGLFLEIGSPGGNLIHTGLSIKI